MVFQKQENEEGKYIGQDGKRYDILSCNVTESKEWYETGEYEVGEDEQGNEIHTPIMAQRIVINKGWDEFFSEEVAAKAYGLTYSPKETNE